MNEKTCAACDCKLEDVVISVTVGGKIVDVCCAECAQTLTEVQNSAALREG